MFTRLEPSGQRLRQLVTLLVQPLVGPATPNSTILRHFGQDGCLRAPFGRFPKQVADGDLPNFNVQLSENQRGIKAEVLHRQSPISSYASWKPHGAFDPARNLSLAAAPFLAKSVSLSSARSQRPNVGQHHVGRSGQPAQPLQPRATVFFPADTPSRHQFLSSSWR